MSDLISTQELVAKIVDTAIRKILSGEQELTKEYEQSVKEVVNCILDTARRERGEAEAQAEIVRCKECANYDTDWTSEMVPDRHYCFVMDGMMPKDGFCHKAERRTDEGD